MTSIRLATVADIDEIFRLWCQLMDTHKAHHPIFGYETDQSEILKKSLTKRFDDCNTKIFVSSDAASHLLGMMVAIFRPTPPGYALKAKGYIAETVVDESAQGQGVGQQLYQAVLAWFREMGADHIELQVSPQNASGLAFWQKKGFEETSKHMILLLNE